MQLAKARAFVLTFVLLAIAVIAVQIADGRFAWGPPELPKNQAEALRPETVRSSGPVDFPDIRYRASVEHDVVREPQNTWSNFAFVFVGAFIFFGSAGVYEKFLGLATIGLGVASGLYHASLLPHWRTIDVVGMGCTSAALVLIGANALGPFVRILPSRRAGQITLSFLAAGSATAIAVFRNDVRIEGAKPFDSTYTTVAGIAIIFLLMASAVLRHTRRGYPIQNLATRIGALGIIIALAVICQVGDHPGHFFCRPNSPLQAHAAWHVLMAIALWLAYRTFQELTVRPAANTG